MSQPLAGSGDGDLREKLAAGLLHLLAKTLRNAGNLQTAAYTAVVLVVAKGLQLHIFGTHAMKELASTQQTSLDSSRVIQTFIVKGGKCTVREFWVVAIESMVIVLDIVVQRTGLGLKDMNVEIAGTHSQYW